MVKHRHLSNKLLLAYQLGSGFPPNRVENPQDFFGVILNSEYLFITCVICTPPSYEMIRNAYTLPSQETDKSLLLSVGEFPWKSSAIMSLGK